MKNYVFQDRKTDSEQQFFDELSKCSMAINLSRGDPIKYYSSDRKAMNEVGMEERESLAHRFDAWRVSR